MLKACVFGWIQRKDRTYLLSGGMSPLTYKIRSVGMLYFDEEKKVNRELRYAPNQKSLFVDEQDDRVQIEHVIFENGALFVPRTNVVLQQLLSNYHPEAGKVWEEIDELQEAVDDIDQIELELEALKLVQELEIEHLEAILRTELGSEVTT